VTEDIGVRFADIGVISLKDSDDRFLRILTAPEDGELRTRGMDATDVTGPQRTFIPLVLAHPRPVIRSGRSIPRLTV
jgi:hypothetical protein